MEKRFIRILMQFDSSFLFNTMWKLKGLLLIIHFFAKAYVATIVQISGTTSRIMYTRRRSILRTIDGLFGTR